MVLTSEAVNLFKAILSFPLLPLLHRLLLLLCPKIQITARTLESVIGFLLGLIRWE